MARSNNPEPSIAERMGSKHEAHRCLRLDGWPHNWKSANDFDDVTAFRNGVTKLGFDVIELEQHGAFISIRAVKATKTAKPTVVIPFQGRS